MRSATGNASTPDGERAHDEVTPYWVAGEQRRSPVTEAVCSPYDGQPAGIVCLPTAQDVEDAVTAAADAMASGPVLPAYVRAAALDHVSAQLTRRCDEIAELITAESGKPVKWSRMEVTRAASVFRTAAEEARRWSGELQRLDTDPAGQGRLALTRRFPRGPVLAITPFNFPLNLVAHKLAPAIAVGAPVIVKPAPKTPLSALILASLFRETDLPAGMLSVLPLPNDRAAELVHDPRLPVVSFTGSGPVGWNIRQAVPLKHVTLELGGNAAAVICPDWSRCTDLDWAARRIATFGNYQAGQSCISVQRVLVHLSLSDAFLDRLIAHVAELRCADPTDPATDVGPLIDEPAATRVEEWIGEATSRGATLHLGGHRDRAFVSPAVLTDVPDDARLWADEVFGPVLAVSAFEDVSEAFERVNHSRYGLQCGVFTHDLQTAFHAHSALEVGGVIVGDVPSYRADEMPYGGIKDSGTGREGVRYAMEDLTYERVLVLSGLTL